MKYTTVQLTEQRRTSFAFHTEGDEIIIDECEGITPADGISLFPEWIIEAMMKDRA